MKLRLNGDSIRLRLSPTDIDTLRQTGELSEVTHFGGQSQIRYGIRTVAEVEDVRASFTNGMLVVEISSSRAGKWTQSEEVGIDHRQNLPDGGSLKIVIEKDFECLHSEENEPGVVLFPNPNFPQQ